MSDTMTVPVIPRVLALMPRTPPGGDPAAARPVQWAVKLSDGSAITIPVDGRPSVTPWPSLQAAEEGLGAYAKPVRQQDREDWEAPG